MSEGYMIYNGPPRQASQFFTKFGLVMKNNTNPADKLCCIACDPRRNLDQNITILDLTRQVKDQLYESCYLSDEHPMK